MSVVFFTAAAAGFCKRLTVALILASAVEASVGFLAAQAAPWLLKYNRR